MAPLALEARMITVSVPAKSAVQTSAQQGFCLNGRLAQLLREAFVHHLFALLPESLCVLGVERIAAYTFVKQAEPCIICDDVTHVAVLAITSSYLFGGRNYGCPH